MDNPFYPSFGKIPSVFLNRGSLTQEIVAELNQEYSPFQTSVIYGQRGSGKTTLMTEVTAQLDKDPKWIVVNLVLDDDVLISLINQLNYVLTGVGVEASVNKQIIENFQFVFQNILEKLTKKGYKVLLCIDEVHLTPLLQKLASVYQIMIRKNLNVSLLMAGLPKNVFEIQNDDVLTFLLRAHRIVLNPLDIESIKESYQHIFKNAGYQIDLKTILYMTKQTFGFTYAFQLLGYHVWNEAQKQSKKEITKQTIDNILDTYISDLNRNVYFKVYSEMSQKEKEFVQAMVKANSTKVKSQIIGEILHKSANYIAVYRRKLIDDQIIKPNGYGYVSFLLPYFDKFVEQQMILEDL